jgi:hypothetical protein
MEEEVVGAHGSEGHFILRSHDLGQESLFALEKTVAEVFPETRFRQIQYQLPPDWVHSYNELAVIVRSISASAAAAYIGKKIVDVVADLIKAKLLSERKPDDFETVLTLYDHGGKPLREIVIPGERRVRIRHGGQEQQ